MLSTKEKKFYTAKNDRVFKSIFCNEDNTYLLEYFLSRLLNIEIKGIVFLRNELNVLHVDSRTKTTDVLVQLNNKYIHIELNTENSTKYIHVRNFTFFTEIYDKKTLRGEEYKTNDKFIHIDLSYRLSDNDIKRSYYVMDKDNKKYIENFEIIEYNMDKIMKFWYSNDIENIYKYLHLIILDLTDVELLYILNNIDLSERDELFVKTYYERTKDLNDDEYYTSQISYEEDKWRWGNTMKKVGYDDGLEKGIEQGIEQNNLTVAKNMKNLNIPIEQISSVTGLSIENIKKI